MSRLDYIPIDFVKAQIIGYSKEYFLNCPLISNKVSSVFKGDLLSKTIFQYRNLKITVFENNDRIELSGSFHTFYNDGKHNYNDFRAASFEAVLNQFKIDLGIKPLDLYIIQLEWGFNIAPPQESNWIIDRLIQHKSKNKTVGIDCSTDGKYVQFAHSTYFLKIYNKGLHFKQKKEILRIEIKQKNWSKYRAKGLSTLQDFINTDKSPFFQELICQFESIILFDLDGSYSDDFLHYQLPTYWKKLRQTKTRSTVKRHIDKLNLLNRTIGRNTKEKIVKQLIQKCDELQV